MCLPRGTASIVSTACILAFKYLKDFHIFTVNPVTNQLLPQKHTYVGRSYFQY